MHNRKTIPVTPCCRSRHWHPVFSADIPDGMLRCELCGKLHDFENLMEVVEDSAISKEQVEALLFSIRSFLGSIPFYSLYQIPENCETLLDLIDHYKMPLDIIIQYILPNLGYSHIRKADGSLESIE